MLIGDYTLPFKIKKFKCKSFTKTGSLLDTNFNDIFDTSIFEVHLTMHHETLNIGILFQCPQNLRRFRPKRLTGKRSNSRTIQKARTSDKVNSFSDSSIHMYQFYQKPLFYPTNKRVQYRKRLNLFLLHPEPVMQSLLYFRKIVRFCIISRQNYFDIKKEMSKTAFLSSCEIKCRFKIHIKW